jgi:putative ABC transport system permease protein
MFRLALENVLHRRLRFALTALAVALGVAFVAGTYMLTDTMNAAFTTFFSQADAKLDVVVQSPSRMANNVASWGDREPMPESILGTVRSVPGVAVAAGQVVGSAQVVDRQGRAITTTGAPTLGLSTVDYAELDTAVLRSGRKPVGGGEVAIDAQTARTHDMRVGDRIRVLFPTGSGTFTLVGIFGIGQLDSMAGATVAAFDLPIAQQLLGKVAVLDSVLVKAQPGVSPDTLRAAVQRAVGQRYEAITGQQLADRTSTAINDSMGFFSVALLVFSAIAIFVGAFIIYNTFAVIVVERTRELGLLRSIGCSTRQLAGSLVVEAAVVGLGASLAGLALGAGICVGLTRLFAASGMELPPAALQLTARTVVVSLLVGVLVTVVAAMGPALRTRKLSPVEALVAGHAAPGPMPVRRVIAGSAACAAGLVAIIYGGFASIENRLPFIGVGALTLFLGVAGLSPLVVRPVARVAGWPIARVFGLSGRLGRENAMRSPVRTARTASALMIGMALVSFVAIFGASLKASTGAMLDHLVGGDYVMTSTSSAPGAGFSPEAAAAVRAQSQVQRVAEMRVGYAERNGKLVGVGGANAAELLAVTSVTVDDGDIRAIDTTDGSVAIASSVASVQGLHAGDSLQVSFEKTGVKQLRIVAVYDDAKGSMGQYLLGMGTFTANFSQQLDAMAIVQLRPGVAPAAAGDALHRALAAYPNVKVQDRAAFRDDVMSQIDQLLTLLYALLLLAVLIALLGIVNTLVLSTIERTRELGLLRAVGMSRREVRSMVRAEAAIVAFIGALIGLLVGLALALVALKALENKGLGVIALPSAQLATFLVVGALAGVVAAVLPARRAARVDVVRAIAAT